MTDHEQQPSAADIAREIRAQETAEKKAKEEKDGKALGQGCLVVIGIAVVIGLFVWLSPSSSTPAETITLPNGAAMPASRATVECRDQIRKLLLSPSTAKFAGAFSDRYTKPRKVGNSWRQVIHVDSENVFSTVVPSAWDCEVSGTTGYVTVTQR